jgi:Ribonuclease G/E
MTIRAAVSPGEIRVAVTGGGGLIDYAIWRPGAPDGVGDVHRGRVTAHLPALAGAFVALEGGASGFLPDSEGGRLPEGSILAVRVTRAAQGGKGPRLSARDVPTRDMESPDGSGPPALLWRGPGALERLAALHPEDDILLDDAALAAQLRPTLAPRLSLVPAAFDEATLTAVEALAGPEAMLPGGARMSVHPTPALTAIDLDLGAGAAGRQGKGAAHDAANRAALPELARQIRLRNLGGGIVVDFAGLSPKRRIALAPALAEALAGDPLQPRLLGFTALGFAEILRPRLHPPLHEVLAGPHAAGLAALRQLAAEQAAVPSRALALRAAPAIVTALRADPAALAALADRTGRPLALRDDASLAPLRWLLEETNG